MLPFLAENLGTIVISLILAGIVTAIIVKLIKDKRKGKCAGCNCGCEGCNARAYVRFLHVEQIKKTFPEPQGGKRPRAKERPERDILVPPGAARCQ
ncbi:MAG: FeoB-associated Cys-rich membrane protein [Clostridiales bacterium]|nr:FeoB-associated Cys-rich membrane protein [Clostridiales bacterium]